MYRLITPKIFFVSSLEGADSTASIELRVWRTCIDVHMVGDEQHFSGNFQDSRIRFRPEFIALHRLGFRNCYLMIETKQHSSL